MVIFFKQVSWQKLFYGSSENIDTCNISYALIQDTVYNFLGKTYPADTIVLDSELSSTRLTSTRLIFKVRIDEVYKNKVTGRH